MLAAAVDGIGGSERPGQVEMADAVADAFDTGRHLLVQAGTGTGKSLGYLAPALIRLARAHRTSGSWSPPRRWRCRASWPTTTSRPRWTRSRRSPASGPGTRSSRAGPTTPACCGSETAPRSDQGTLISAGDLADTIKSAPLSTPESALGAEVLALREWAEEQADGRRAGRSRRRPVAHRTGLAAGVDPGSGVPGRAALPLRRRVLRREVAGRGPGGRPGGDQPRPAGHQRDARRHRAARAHVR